MAAEYDRFMQKIKYMIGLFGILAAILLSLSACHSGQEALSSMTQPESTQEIINGKTVKKNHATFAMTARILKSHDDAWFPICSASIVSQDLILTAAHCVIGSAPSDLRIAFGAQPLTSAGQENRKTRIDVVTKFKTVAVKKIESHPGFGHTSYDDDMALLLLESEIPAGFRPVSLLSETEAQKISEKKSYPILLVGFGMFAEEPMVESAILRGTSVSGRFEGDHLITDQTKGSGGCNGDSGGPAYLKVGKTYFLVGVTHGPTDGANDCHHEGVWGNPNKEKDFLNQAAEKMGSPTRF
jgi:secreted trypsin-like serine protease